MFWKRDPYRYSHDRKTRIHLKSLIIERLEVIPYDLVEYGQSNPLRTQWIRLNYSETEERCPRQLVDAILARCGPLPARRGHR